MRANVQHIRGADKARHLKDDDFEVSLCSTISSGALPQARTPTRAQEVTKYPLQNPCPPRNQSWITIENACIPIKDSPAVRQSIIQQPTADAGYDGDLTRRHHESSPATDNPAFDQKFAESVFSEFDLGPENSEDDVIQQGGDKRITVEYIGRALRAGYEIPRPAVTKVGGQTVTEQEGVFFQRVVGTLFGCKIYEATWKLVYLMPNSPGKTGVPDLAVETRNAP
jgi:hypothetical protein